MTMLYLVIACGLLSVVYAIWATQSVMAADQGNAQAQNNLELDCLKKIWNLTWTAHAF